MLKQRIPPTVLAEEALTPQAWANDFLTKPFSTAELALSRMSAGIIHEINNPMNYAYAGLHALEMFTKHLPDGDQPDFADLAEIVGRSRRMVSHPVGQEIESNLRSPSHALIRGYSNQLVQVFMNFFQNSIDAIQAGIAKHGGEKGQIDVAINPAGDGWQVTIRENGIGIPPENLQQIVDPFFTSKEVGKGMGLG